LGFRGRLVSRPMAVKRLRFRIPLPRTLRGRLIAGLVALLAVACAAVGLVTYLAVQGSLSRELNSQLQREVITTVASVVVAEDVAEVVVETAMDVAVVAVVVVADAALLVATRRSGNPSPSWVVW